MARGRKGTSSKKKSDQSVNSYDDASNYNSESDYYASDATDGIGKKKRSKFGFRKKKKKGGGRDDSSSVSSNISSRTDNDIDVRHVNIPMQAPGTPTRRNADDRHTRRLPTGTANTFGTTDHSSGFSADLRGEAVISTNTDTSQGDNAADRRISEPSFPDVGDNDSIGDDSSASSKSSSSKLTAASWKLNNNIARTKFNLGQVYMVKRMHDKAQQSFEEALGARTKLHGAMHPEVAKVHEMMGKLAERREGGEEPAKKHYQEAFFIYSMVDMVENDSSPSDAAKGGTSAEGARLTKKELKKKRMDKMSSMKMLTKNSAMLNDINELKDKINELKRRKPPQRRNTTNEYASFVMPGEESGRSVDSFTSNNDSFGNLRNVESRETTSLGSTNNDSYTTATSVTNDEFNVTNQTWQECMDAGERYMQSANYVVANKCFKTTMRLLVASAYSNNKGMNVTIDFHSEDDDSTYGVHDDHVGHVRWKMGICESMMNNRHDAQRHFQVALRLLRPRLGNRNDKIADILSDCGDLHRQYNENGQALDCYKECLSIRSYLLGNDHKDTTAVLQKNISTLARAADIATEEGKIDQSLNYHKEVLNLIETMYDQHDPETKKRRTKELILTAHVLLSKKRYDEALEYLDTAKDETDEFTNFSGSEKMSLLRSQTMITIKNLQSYVYERQGNYDKAIFCLDESVDLTSEIYGATSEQYAKVLATQGFLFAKIQEGDKAITNFKRSTSIYVSCQGTVNYEDYIKSLDTMISIYMQREEVGIAKMVLQDKLATGLQFKGERSQVVATTYKELGIMNFQEESYEEALSNFSQAVDVGAYVFKSHDEEFVNTLRYYAVTSDILGNYDDALNAYQQILDLVDSGAKMPIYNAMGFICNVCGRYEEALSHFNKALVIQEVQSSQGRDIDDDSATDRNSLKKHLGNTYFSIGRTKDALFCYGEIIDSSETSNSAQEEKLQAIYNKSTVLCHNKKYLEAKTCVKEGLHLARKLRKPESMRLLWSGLGACEFALTNYEKAIKCFRQSLDLNRETINKNDIGMRFNMGLAYLKLGQSLKSIETFQQALVSLEKLLSALKPTNHKTRELLELKADILYNMGNMYLKENQMREADIFFTNAIKAVGNLKNNEAIILRSKHSLALITCKEVKNNRKDVSELDAAIKIFYEVQKETVRIHGEKHLDVAKISVDIAVALFLQGNYEDAQEKCSDAFKVLSETLSSNHSYYQQAVRLSQSISKKMLVNRIACKSSKNQRLSQNDDTY